MKKVVFELAVLNKNIDKSVLCAIGCLYCMSVRIWRPMWYFSIWNLMEITYLLRCNAKTFLRKLIFIICFFFQCSFLCNNLIDAHAANEWNDSWFHFVACSCRFMIPQKNVFRTQIFSMCNLILKQQQKQRIFYYNSICSILSILVM